MTTIDEVLIDGDRPIKEVFRVWGREREAEIAAILAAGGVGATMYPDTATGIAATVDGQFFTTPSADPNVAYILYENQTEVAVEIARVSTQSYVEDAVDDFNAAAVYAAARARNAVGGPVLWTVGSSYATAVATTDADPLYTISEVGGALRFQRTGDAGDFMAGIAWVVPDTTVDTRIEWEIHYQANAGAITHDGFGFVIDPDTSDFTADPVSGAIILIQRTGGDTPLDRNFDDSADSGIAIAIESLDPNSGTNGLVVDAYVVGARLKFQVDFMNEPDGDTAVVQMWIDDTGVGNAYVPSKQYRVTGLPRGRFGIVARSTAADFRAEIVEGSAKVTPGLFLIPKRVFVEPAVSDAETVEWRAHNRGRRSYGRYVKEVLRNGTYLGAIFTKARHGYVDEWEGESGSMPDIFAAKYLAAGGGHWTLVSGNVWKTPIFWNDRQQTIANGDTFYDLTNPPAGKIFRTLRRLAVNQTVVTVEANPYYASVQTAGADIGFVYVNWAGEDPDTHAIYYAQYGTAFLIGAETAFDADDQYNGLVRLRRVNLWFPRDECIKVQLCRAELEDVICYGGTESVRSDSSTGRAEFVRGLHTRGDNWKFERIFVGTGLNPDSTAEAYKWSLLQCGGYDAGDVDAGAVGDNLSNHHGEVDVDGGVWEKATKNNFACTDNARIRNTVCRDAGVSGGIGIGFSNNAVGSRNSFIADNNRVYDAPTAYAVNGGGAGTVLDAEIIGYSFDCTEALDVVNTTSAGGSVTVRHLLRGDGTISNSGGTLEALPDTRIT
jgi:hypothetical protein